MARYDSRVAAAATGIPEGWLSSLLTRVPLTGVSRGCQGRRRTLSLDAVVCVALAHMLTEHTGASCEAAVATAHALLRSSAGAITWGPSLMRLSCDVGELRRRLRSDLDRAVEAAVEVPRGRPRRRSIAQLP